MDTKGKIIVQRVQACVDCPHMRFDTVYEGSFFCRNLNQEISIHGENYIDPDCRLEDESHYDFEQLVGHYLSV